jgi:GNAT superfamily N-acetyltransferase
MLTIVDEREPFLLMPAEIYSDPAVVTKANVGVDRELFRDSQRFFVAMRDGKMRARCVARVREGLGMLGYFEACNDPEAVTLMLAEAIVWLREQNVSDIIGPIDGDTWHRYRVTAGPWEVAPFVLEPQNPRYYASLWETAGAEVAESYVSQQIADIEPLLPRISAAASRASEHGYTIRSIDPSKLNDELAIVWNISREIFRNNAYYFDIDLPDFLQLYQGIERLLVPELVLFAEDREHTPVGFLFAYPDRAPDVVNYKTIGVLREHRGSGAAAALQERGYRAALDRRARIANHCLIREGNRSESMDGGAGTVFRRYLLYRFAE